MCASCGVFVSSPADVKVERQRIDQVAKRLNHAFDGRVQIEAVRWEEQIYSSHTTFQAQIIDAAQCDLVIAIFWSRFGHAAARHSSLAWKAASATRAAPPTRC